MQNSPHSSSWTLSLLVSFVVACSGQLQGSIEPDSSVSDASVLDGAPDVLDVADSGEAQLDAGLGRRDGSTERRDVGLGDLGSGAPDLGVADSGMGVDMGDVGADVGPATCSVLTSTSPLTHTLGAGEHYTLSDALFDGGGRVVYLQATPGSGASVVIRGNVFQNLAWGVHIRGVDEVIVEGNYFRDIHTAIRIYTAERVTVRYNKVARFGVRPPASGLEGYWSGNFLQIVDSTLQFLDIGYNLVDRSTDSRPNTHANTYGEDHINLNHVVYVGPGFGSIHDNYLRGSATHNESTHGGGIIFDQACDRFRVERNVLVNTAQYLMGNANSTAIEFIDNIGFIEWAHDFSALPNVRNTRGSGGPNITVGVITSAFGDGHIGHTLFRDNRILAERSNAAGTGLSSHFNWFPVGESTFENNNFTRRSPTGGPGPAPEGTSIIADDMFGTYGTGPEYFAGLCLP